MGWEGRKGRRDGRGRGMLMRSFRSGFSESRSNACCLLQVVASSPHPARGVEFKSDEGRGNGRATLMITVRLRTHPRSHSVPAKFEFDRPLFSFASTYSNCAYSNRRCQLSVGRSGLSLPPPPSPTRKKANTFNAPSPSPSPFVPLDRNCQTDICILAFLSVPISAQRANMLHRGEGEGE